MASPPPVSDATSRRMARVAQRDTAAELAVRKALFAAGLRYRVHVPVPRRPRRTIDIAITRSKVAVFIDGCFWHGCPVHGTQSKTNSEWWRQKIDSNRGRDADTNASLLESGWLVLRIWEYESARDATEAVVSALRSRGPL